MRCKHCNGYIPEGLNVKGCMECGSAFHEISPSHLTAKAPLKDFKPAKSEEANSDDNSYPIIIDLKTRLKIIAVFYCLLAIANFLIFLTHLTVGLSSSLSLLGIAAAIYYRKSRASAIYLALEQLGSIFVISGNALPHFPLYVQDKSIPLIFTVIKLAISIQAVRDTFLYSKIVQAKNNWGNITKKALATFFYSIIYVGLILIFFSFLHTDSNHSGLLLETSLSLVYIVVFLALGGYLPFTNNMPFALSTLPAKDNTKSDVYLFNAENHKRFPIDKTSFPGNEGKDRATPLQVNKNYSFQIQDWVAFSIAHLAATYVFGILCSATTLASVEAAVFSLPGRLIFFYLISLCFKKCQHRFELTVNILAMFVGVVSLGALLSPAVALNLTEAKKVEYIITRVGTFMIIQIPGAIYLRKLLNKKNSPTTE